LAYLDDILTYWETNEGKKAHKQYMDFLPYEQLWSHHFDLDIMDFYSEDYNGDIFHHFLCQYVPGLNGSCEYVTRDKEQAKAAPQSPKGGVTHARVGGSAQPLRAFFHVKDLYNISIPEEASEQLKMKLKFVKHCNDVFAKFGILSDPNYLDCINPVQEARLRNYSATVMQVFHEKQNGKPMTDEELAIGMARQDALFEKNKVKWKYCDVNMEKLFSNVTVTKELVEFSLPEWNLMGR
jgi:hypothetical protein